MRIDEIDLYGNLLISGFTGSEGQILTYGDSGLFAWGTASSVSSGPTSSYFKTSGYNYVICETVNTNDSVADAITNGDNLINAYVIAKTLDVGTKSATNRVVVLLMPGDYDLSSAQFQLDTSFIDIVGISSNPYNTILRSSSQFATLQYTAAVDSALKNVHLKQGATLGVDDSEGSGDGSYLRWENLIISGTCFDVGYFYNLDGEFENITVLDGGYFALVSNSISGTYKNINIGDTGYAFYAIVSLTGTYKNITISNVNSGTFYTGSGGSIAGIFEDIEITSQSAPIFGADGLDGFSGTFRNIKIYGTPGNVFYGLISNSIFEDIEIVSGGYIFLTGGGGIDGTFKNIKIGNSSGSVFGGNDGSDFLSGTYSNISIGDVTNNAFYAGPNISGNFKDISIGNVGISTFISINGSSYVTGTYENITMGNVTNDAFKTTDMISGSFKNITIGDITNNNAFYADSASGQILGTFDEIQIGNIASTGAYFFTTGATMSGTFSNIEIGDASEWATGGISMFVSNSSGSITGSYKNIKVGNTSGLLSSGNVNGILNGTFENIEFGSTSYAFYANHGSILGTYSNIKSFSPQERVFTSATDLIGTFENIEISNSINTSAFTSTNSLSGTFRNIKLGDLSGAGSVFTSGGSFDFTGTFENIEVGSGNGISSYIFYTGGIMIGTFSNIKIGGGWYTAFISSSGFSGYFKDIYIPTLQDLGFPSGKGQCFNSFGSFSSTSIIDNLWCDNQFNTPLNGCKLLNSYINGGSFWGLAITSDQTIIENCEILGDLTGPICTIYSSSGSSLYNVQILYTATSNGLCPVYVGFTPTNSGVVALTPNYNIP